MGSPRHSGERSQASEASLAAASIDTLARSKRGRSARAALLAAVSSDSRSSVRYFSSRSPRMCPIAGLGASALNIRARATELSSPPPLVARSRSSRSGCRDSRARRRRSMPATNRSSIRARTRAAQLSSRIGLADLQPGQSHGAFRCLRCESLDPEDCDSLALSRHDARRQWILLIERDVARESCADGRSIRLGFVAEAATKCCRLALSRGVLLPPLGQVSCRCPSPKAATNRSSARRACASSVAVSRREVASL